jgi:beta-glucosidase
MSTVAVERLGIPKVHVTDGPNGARGASFPGAGGPPSACIPCGSAIGATWNPALAEALGALVGREALARGCRGLLAPTVNLHRSPLAGRNFECFSEDPLLSGRLAAGYVRGVQSESVFATVKHFVGNEAEFERNSINSVIDERALRELYLVPFELAVGEGGALAIMTAYNRVNGRWLTQQRDFLLGILREEWGFEGLVMTDWFGVAETTTSLGAGLDLEMPGPSRALGATVAKGIADGTVDEADLDAAVTRLLCGFDRIGALDAPEPVVNPMAPSPGDVRLLRRASAESMVLLANDGTLPLEPLSLTRLAVIGPHAVSPCIMGGGSAQVTPHDLESPLDSLSESCGRDMEIVYERGCEVTRSPAIVGRAVLRAPAGFRAERFAGTDFAGAVIEESQLTGLRMVVFGNFISGTPRSDWSMRVRGTVIPEESGVFALALAQAGRARLLINGDLIIDGFSNPPPKGGSDFFGQASQDVITEYAFERGVPVEMVVEYACIETTLAGFRVGFRTSDPDLLLERAVAAAAGADVTVVLVGTTEEWETEGRDRTDFGLPGRQDELINRVAAASRHTVVVVNAAAPVEMSWASEVNAVIQCWFGGQEMGGALADVLLGTAEPGGRLPTTIPFRLEHNPSFDNFPGENGEVRYGESVFMGYRGYEHRAITPRFPFGHGLSYSSFALGEPALSASTYRAGVPLTVSVPVTNAGGRAGCEVVQCYIAPSSSRLARPPKELKAFGKVTLEPGESSVVELLLDDRSFAYWDPAQADWDDVRSRLPEMATLLSPPSERRTPGWYVDAGSYDILIGRSSADITARCRVEVPPEESWRLQ